MKVLIISSSSIEIEASYLTIAHKISTFLAHKKFDLIFGGSSLSMMGVCYQVFQTNKRKVYADTIFNYSDDLKKLEKTISSISKTTFDLKKEMFEKCDLIVCLPGGIGTLSEILAYLEEKRSNNSRKPIIIYDETNFYKGFKLQLEQMKNEGFILKKDNNLFKLIDNMEEFKKEINNYVTNGGRQ